ncbi:LiaI-LiaF-like domain-containing protein [Oceanithermus sp.]
MTLGWILIAVGLAWLLADLGYLPSAVLGLWRLWPLLLVALGLELLLGHDPKGRRLSALVLVALLFAAGFWLAFGPPPSGPFVRESLRVPLAAEVRTARLRLDTSVAQLELSALPTDAETLLDAELERLPRQRILLERKRRGERMELRLRSEGRNLRLQGRAPLWKLGLHPAVRYDLDLRLGVGQGRLDLRELELEGLAIHAGVGDLTVFFPAKGGYQARVEGGVGRLTLLLPSGLPVELEVEKGIGRVAVSGLGGGGRRWSSAGSGPPLRLAVEAGVGQVEVRVLEAAPYLEGD